jgi:predicted nuclease with RNAse H fold
MLTIGVDLAAQATGTAVAWLDWSATGAVVRDVVHPAEDAAVVAAIGQASKAGIDCPLGWPDEFVSFVHAHRTGTVAVPDGVVGRDWRRGLAYRVTDLVVRDQTGLLPLSVAADRIGHTAMRCAAILAHLANHGYSVDRRGTGVVVEVYPAASLKQWHLPHRGYKRPHNVAELGKLVDALQQQTPWLHLGAYESACRRSDHALDAVIAALTARAAHRGLTTQPDKHQTMSAATEGWIAIPTCPIHELPYSAM